MYTNVHSSLIHNRPKLEPTPEQTRGVNKQTCIPYYGIGLTKKRGSAWTPLKIIVLGIRNQTKPSKEDILCGFLSINP